MCVTSGGRDLAWCTHRHWTFTGSSMTEGQLGQANLKSPGIDRSAQARNVSILVTFRVLGFLNGAHAVSSPFDLT